MALLNDVKFISGIAGTSDFTIGTVATGFQSPITAGAINGERYAYTARVGSEFESGLATYNSGIVQRTTITDSSSGAGIKVSFSSPPTVVLTVLSGDLMGVFNAQGYGWIPDGTDRSTQALALLSLVNSCGGGTIYFPPSTGKYRADSQLLIPNDGQSQPTQVNIRLTGAGGGGNWYQASAPNASILDLRYVSGNANAKIETRGLGCLVIDNLTFEDGGSSNSTPIVHSTNTSLTIRDTTFIGSGNTSQDAIVLGGTSGAEDGTVSAAFVGYGTIIDSCHFSKLNRGVYGRTVANSVVFSNNHFQGNVGTIAIEFDGTQSQNSGIFGLTVRDNTIEMDIYTYGIVLTSVSGSLFSANSFWDAGGNLLANYRLVSSVSDCTFISGYSSGGTTKQFSDPNGCKPLNLIIGSFSGFHAFQFQQSDTGLAATIVPPGNVPTTKPDGGAWYNNHMLSFQSGGVTHRIAFTDSPVTVSAASYTMLETDTSLICDRAGTVTITLLDAASYSGRSLDVKTVQNQIVVSATSNVVPQAGGSAGTAILAGTAGKWATLQSDGTNWIAVKSG